MSSFRPGGRAAGRMAHIGYSPYCVPRVIGGVKCVIVDERLREIEPMAWDFVMNFARDNRLQVTQACLIEPASRALADSPVQLAQTTRACNAGPRSVPVPTRCQAAAAGARAP